MDVMLDLETMGTRPTAAIVAIGAVAFDVPTATVHSKFYTPVSLESAVAAGCDMDASTVLWWMKQSDAARAAFSGGGMQLVGALHAFSDWLSGLAPPDDVQVWGNGAGFDNVLLASAYRIAGVPRPWKHWNDRCYRTVKAMYPAVELVRVGTHHNALDDAESQAKHLMAMLAAKE